MLARTLIPLLIWLPGLAGDLGPEEIRQNEVFRRAAPSVVNVNSLALRRNFFSLDVFEIPRGSGSGFIWDRKGHVVTNFHVLEGGSSFQVTLSDQSTWEAKLALTYDMKKCSGKS